MSYSSFKIILIHVKNIIPIITATLILNYLNNSERSLVKQILIEDEIIVWFLCEQKIFISNDYISHFILPTASLSKDKRTTVLSEKSDFLSNYTSAHCV